MKTSHTLLALACLAPGLASASGFALNEQSVKSMGTALAGRASSAEDATTLYGNPAGMSRLSGINLSGNATYIFVPADIENTSGFPNTGTNDGDMIPPQWVGSSFATLQVNDVLTAGIGMYAPFGLATNYEDSFQGRYFGDKSKVKTFAIQPTASLRLNDRFSLGAGLVISKIEGTLSKYITPLAPGSHVLIRGDDMSHSFNLGALAEISDSTRVGVTFHSRTRYQLAGTTHVSNLAAIGGSADYPASLDIATPASWDLSITHKASPTLTVHGLLSQTGWGVLDELVIKNAGAPGALAVAKEELHWGTTWLYSLGAEWRYSDAITLRSGIGHDETPIDGAYRSVRVPSADRDYISFGLGWRWDERTSFDLSYSFLKEDTAHINRTENGLTYTADFKGSGHLFGMQANLKF